VLIGKSQDFEGYSFHFLIFYYPYAVIFGIFGANVKKVGTSDIAVFTVRKDLIEDLFIDGIFVYNFGKFLDASSFY